MAPVLGQTGQRRRPKFKLLHHLIAQQSAKTRTYLCKSARARRRNGLPPEEVAKQPFQPGRRGQCWPGSLDVAAQPDNVALQLAVAPDRKGIAVGVDEVRQGFEFSPLHPVVFVLETSRVSALAGRFDFDKTNQRATYCHRVVGAGPQRGEPGFANDYNVTSPKEQKSRQISDQLFERRAELVFRRAYSGLPGKLRLERDAEA
jgi:hypothetical protein